MTKEIELKKILYSKRDGLKKSQLSVEISGKTASCELVNTIRRLILEHVPTYTFDKSTINIEENTTIFDDDYMELRLSQLIIPDLSDKFDISYLHEKFWKDIDFTDPERDRHEDDNLEIQLIINKVNNTHDIMNITTNDCEVVIDGEKVEPFDKKYPILITQLRTKEVFKCVCNAVLCIGKRNDIWSGGHTWFSELSNNKFQLNIESQGQIPEHLLIMRGCEGYIERLEEIKTNIANTYNRVEFTKSKKIKLSLENDDHTVGSMINRIIQDHSNVIFSGVSRPSLLQDGVIITVATDVTNPVKIILDCIDKTINIFKDIIKQTKLINK